MTEALSGTPIVSVHGAFRPSLIAVGTIAHSLNARVGILRRAFLSPTEQSAGNLGILAGALPMRSAHQLTETATAKASAAVWPLSSVARGASLPWRSWTWWQSIGGQSPISSMSCRIMRLWHLVPSSEHGAYTVSVHVPDVSALLSLGLLQRSLFSKAVLSELPPDA